MAGLDQDILEALAARLGEALVGRSMRLVTAESCTGGWVAQACTAVAGSSAWFERGFVTYSNDAKVEMLGVLPDTLAVFGAVSEATVIEMADGALRRGHAQAALAISGIAGPSGGSDSKPVGTVCFAWAVAGQPARASTEHFDGDRRLVRMQAVRHAIERMLADLSAMP